MNRRTRQKEGKGTQDSRWIRGYPDEYCKRSLGVNIFSFLLSYFCFFPFPSLSIVYFSSPIPPMKSNLQSSICTSASNLPYHHLTIPIPFDPTNILMATTLHHDWRSTSLLFCKLKQTSGIIIPYLLQLVYVKLKSDWTSWRYRDYNSSRSDVSAFIFLLFFCFYCFVLVQSGFGQLVAVIISYYKCIKMWARVGWINSLHYHEHV